MYIENYINKNMFNNCNSASNGELSFYNSIKNNIQVIFDVGCRSDSCFLNFKGEVHYFDPVKQFIDNLKTQNNSNKASYFNNFGLGEENKSIDYYPKYQSFFDRIKSCNQSDAQNKITLDIRKGQDYMLENNIQSIDFLKIDTEGYEMNVLLGFNDYLNNIKIIQFEYGGTFMDNGVKLIDVVNYLEQNGFHKFSYLSPNGPILIQDFQDHYQYCNIVCVHKHSNLQIP
jgi:FkbM family methyltransferase